MRAKDKYHVEYLRPYYYVLGDDNKSHFGFYKFKSDAEWRAAWLNSQQAHKDIMA